MSRATDLRDEFDRSFADAPPEERSALVDLLGVRIGGEPYALPLAQISTVLLDARVTPLPTRSASLLGVTLVRALLVAVYDLRVALGARSDLAPRWIAVAAHHASGYAFDGLDGVLRMPATELPSARSGLVRGRVVLDLTAIDVKER